MWSFFLSGLRLCGSALTFPQFMNKSEVETFCLPVTERELGMKNKSMSGIGLVVVQILPCVSVSSII